MGYSIPPESVSSEAIESRLAPLYERLKLPFGRLELMTGIRERHFWPGEKLPSAAAAEAGEAVLNRSRFSRESIDVLIHCGVCRDRLEPSTASYVHRLLKLSPKCQIFDISNACLGFLNAIVTAGSMIQSGVAKRILLVSGENGKPLLEHTIKTLLSSTLDRKSIKPYFANLTIGAGAVAYLIGHTDEIDQKAPRLIGGIVETDSEANQLCQGDATSGGGLEMLTEAELLLEAGLSVAKKGWNRFLKTIGWGAEMVDRIVCHQVGRTHQRRLLETIGVDPELDFATYPFLGNVGSVSLPITLARAIEAGAVSSGNRVALLGIGSGISAMMLGLQA